MQPVYLYTRTKNILTKMLEGRVVDMHHCPPDNSLAYKVTLVSKEQG